MLGIASRRGPACLGQGCTAALGRPANPASQPVSVGGQAVVEGVMMRAPGATSVAVRRPDGSLVVRVRRASRLADRRPWVGKPGIRGAAVLWETLSDGMSALSFSADQAMPEEDRKKAGPFALAASMATSVLFALVLFAVLPHGLTWGLGRLLGSEALSGGRAWSFHLVDGLLKFGLFLAFVWLTGRLPEMRRVFQYHGAEHQAVHAFEEGRPLTPESLGQFPTAHERCGTAFIVTVIAVSILVFTALFPLLPPLTESVAWNQALYVAIKVPMVIPIAALSYEVIRWAWRQRNGVFGRIVSGPGVFVQRITTKPPDRDQQEVALVALRSALRPMAFGTGEEAIRAFADYGDFDHWIASFQGES